MSAEEKGHRVKHEMREGKTNAQARKIKKYNEKSDESSSVDLAPMVDIALLLLMFFMVTTSFNKPNVFLMGLPKESKTNSKPVPVNPNFVMTIQIAKSGNVYVVRGLEGPNNPPKLVPVEEVAKYVEKVRQAVIDDPENKQKSEVVTVVKIHKKSLYDSMINALDEVFKGGVQKWATTEMKDEEMAKIDELDKSAGGAKQ